MSADRGYLGRQNVEAIEGVGAVPYIPLKRNTSPVGPDQNAWTRLYHRFMYDRDNFMARYHQRSNVESTFAMIKGKFGDSVMSKSRTGQRNEVLCKVLAHNVIIVGAAIHEFGIEPSFCAGGSAAQIVAS